MEVRKKYSHWRWEKNIIVEKKYFCKVKRVGKQINLFAPYSNFVFMMHYDLTFGSYLNATLI
jgi:hypothetical protein